MINIHLVRGDITKLEVDAIVNAAHEGLNKKRFLLSSCE